MTFITTFILSGEYPTEKSILTFIEEHSSKIGIQISSIAQGTLLTQKSQYHHVLEFHLVIHILSL